MHPSKALLAFALVSLPLAAQAQSLPAGQPAPAPAITATEARPGALTTAVALTQRGVHRRIERTLVHGLAVVDRQDIDVDGDGDLDALVLLDVAPSDPEPKVDRGRGVAVIFRERRGWRAETVASVPLVPFEAGYNWGRVESLRAGAAPLVHVLFSQAGPTGARQADAVLQFRRGALRTVYSNAVESVPGTGEHAVTRALAVQTADVDGDGTGELVERVAESRACPDGVCVTPDGLFAPVVTRRVLRWDAAREAFVEDASLRAHLRESARALDEAMLRWRNGDLAGRDASIARAYALDPLDARVRMAYARLQLRQGEYAAALDTLEYAWPQGYGRDARVLRAEAAARGGDAHCRLYLDALANDPEAHGAERVARLATLAPSCRAPASP